MLFIYFVCYSYSFESMQRLCDKYNRAIDSIHQLVSHFLSLEIPLFPSYRVRAFLHKNTGNILSYGMLAVFLWSFSSSFHICSVHCRSLIGDHHLEVLIPLIPSFTLHRLKS